MRARFGAAPRMGTMVLFYPVPSLPVHFLKLLLNMRWDIIAIYQIHTMYHTFNNSYRGASHVWCESPVLVSLAGHPIANDL